MVLGDPTLACSTRSPPKAREMRSGVNYKKTRTYQRVPLDVKLMLVIFVVERFQTCRRTFNLTGSLHHAIEGVAPRRILHRLSTGVCFKRGLTVVGRTDGSGTQKCLAGSFIGINPTYHFFMAVLAPR